MNIVLRMAVKAMNTGAVAFRKQMGLGCQPMLHVVAWSRTLVHIIETGKLNEVQYISTYC